MKKLAKKLTRKEIQRLHAACAKNLATWPAICTKLSKQLGVSCTSLTTIEAGYYPLGGYWTFPERDAAGEVVGLSTRTIEGKKFMVPGSKHGLFFVPNIISEDNEYESWGWQRTDVDHPCPLCDKPDGCLYPKGDYENPAAITCIRVSEGPTFVQEAKKGFGSLHILDPVRNNARMANRSILTPTNHPYLIIEGASDTCAAFDLGFVGVGRHNDKASDMLLPLLHGKNACVVGENDKGAGVKGMEKTFVKLYDICHTCTKVLPIPEVKDLRQWKQAGLTQAMLLQHIAQAGETSLDLNVFESRNPRTIAKEFLWREKTTNGIVTLHSFRKEFADFDGNTYQQLEDDEIKGQVCNFLEGKSYINAEGDLVEYMPTRANIGDIIQNFFGDSNFLVKGDPPMYLHPKSKPDVRRLIIFKNGILDADEYIAGRVSLMNPDPNIFSFNVFPYDFDEDADSQMWREARNEILLGDTDKIRLMNQWWGYNTIPCTEFVKLMMYKGVPGTAKSTCVDVMQDMLGRNNCGATDFSVLATGFPYETVMGKLAAICGDSQGVKESQIGPVLGMLLRITGGDDVPGRIKFVSGVKSPLIKLFCRFTFGLNKFPAFKDNSGALMRRALIINFLNKFEGKKDITGLRDELCKEAASGKLINFALRGLKDLYQNKGFIVPKDMEVALGRFKTLVSPITPFMEACVQDGGSVSTFLLCTVWRWWCDIKGLRPGAMPLFVNDLLEAQTAAEEVGDIITGISLTEWAITQL